MKLFQVFYKNSAFISKDAINLKKKIRYLNVFRSTLSFIVKVVTLMLKDISP